MEISGIYTIHWVSIQNNQGRSLSLTKSVEPNKYLVIFTKDNSIGRSKMFYVDTERFDKWMNKHKCKMEIVKNGI